MTALEDDESEESEEEERTCMLPTKASSAKGLNTPRLPMQTPTASRFSNKHRELRTNGAKIDDKMSERTVFVLDKIEATDTTGALDLVVTPHRRLANHVILFDRGRRQRRETRTTTRQIPIASHPRSRSRSHSHSRLCLRSLCLACESMQSTNRSRGMTNQWCPEAWKSMKAERIWGEPNCGATREATSTARGELQWARGPARESTTTADHWQRTAQRRAAPLPTSTTR